MISLDERLNLASDILYCIVVHVNFFQMLNLLTKFTGKKKTERPRRIKESKQKLMFSREKQANNFDKVSNINH
jgi:hypothetical protein